MCINYVLWSCFNMQLIPFASCSASCLTSVASFVSDCPWKSVIMMAKLRNPGGLNSPKWHSKSSFPCTLYKQDIFNVRYVTLGENMICVCISFIPFCDSICWLCTWIHCSERCNWTLLPCNESLCFPCPCYMCEIKWSGTVCSVLSGRNCTNPK